MQPRKKKTTHKHVWLLVLSTKDIQEMWSGETPGKMLEFMACYHMTISMCTNYSHSHILLINTCPDTICDRIWEKVHYRAYYQNRVIGTTG